MADVNSDAAKTAVLRERYLRRKQEADAVLAGVRRIEREARRAQSGEENKGEAEGLQSGGGRSEAGRTQSGGYGRPSRAARLDAEIAGILEQTPADEESRRMETMRRMKAEATERVTRRDNAAWALAEADLASGSNLQEAAELLNELANREDTRAIMKFAELFETGKVYPKDPGKALECLLWAEELGDRNADYEIGRFYRLGIGTEPDRRKAAGYFEKASKLKISEADYQLAALYFEMGRPEDGVLKLSECVKAGIPGAAYQFALCLFYGEGIREDRRAAVRLLRECAAAGDEEAREKLKFLRDTELFSSQMDKDTEEIDSIARGVRQSGRKRKKESTRS